MHDHALFWPLLDGGELAVVSGQPHALGQRVLDRGFVRANGGEVTWSITATVLCPPVGEHKWPYWPRTQEELGRSDWNVLLCSAGVLSALVCDHTCRTGRKTLNLGGLNQVSSLALTTIIARPFW